MSMELLIGEEETRKLAEINVVEDIEKLPCWN